MSRDNSKTVALPESPSQQGPTMHLLFVWFEFSLPKNCLFPFVLLVGALKTLEASILPIAVKLCLPPVQTDRSWTSSSSQGLTFQFGDNGSSSEEVPYATATVQTGESSSSLGS